MSAPREAGLQWPLYTLVWSLVALQLGVHEHKWFLVVCAGVVAFAAAVEVAFRWCHRSKVRR